ncbi:MAG: OmpA family protein [Subdoligranulum sp.]|jgi:outer membrane protein OmpA-like peptidoglycan-associated protein
MKKLFRKMAALLAGALTAAVLTGCSMFPSQTEQPTATDTVLLMTQGDGMPALNKDEDVEEFLSCVNTTLGGSASLVITDGNPQVIGPVRFDEEKANSVQQEKTDKKKSAEVAEMVKSAAASTPETDLISALSLSARLAASGTAEDKQIVIRHSGVNTADSLPMQELDLVSSDITDLIDQLDAEALIPDLQGVKIHFFGLGDVAGSQQALSKKQVKWLQSFWQSFFERSGAEVTFHADIVSGNALTNGHSVTPVTPAEGVNFVKFSSKKVEFKPDSDDFLDEETARSAIAEVAAQMKEGSAHYIIAGSTAKVDNPTQDGPARLSLLRAQAVRQVLVDAGVDAERLTCVGLGNEVTSVRDMQEEANNRAVYLVAEGQAQADEFLRVGLQE